MDFQTKKVLKYLNSHGSMRFSLAQLFKIFPNIDKDYLVEIIQYLNKQDYIKFVGDSSVKSTNKGKTYFSVKRSEWISEHIVETLALIISFLAFILSIIALAVSLLK